MTAHPGTVNRADLAHAAGRAPVGRLRTIGAVALVIGGAAWLWALMGGQSDRAWESYHFNFLDWVGVSQALVVFAASQKLTRARWSGVIIRLAEAAVGLVIAAPVLYLGLVLGRGHLFAALPVTRGQVGWWFTEPFYLVRNWLLLVLMAWLSWRFVRRDVAPDAREVAEGRPVDLDAAEQGRLSRDAAILIVAWALCYSLLGFDMIMSLAPRWVSNLYGAFFFMGNFLAALALLAVLTLALRGPMGIRPLVSGKQLHDLGKLTFGFTVFWGYLMWAQFLVIWYGNLPDETYWIFYRLWGPWRGVGTAVFLMVFVIPFIGLLGVKPKKHPPTFALFTLISLTGLWLERYLEIVPSLNGGQGPALGVPEIGAAAFFFGCFLLAYSWFAGRNPMVSPRLAAATLEAEHH